MDIDKLKVCWENETLPGLPDDQELENTFRISIRSVAGKFQRRMYADMLLAGVTAGIMILLAYLLGLKYREEAALMITAFALLLTGLHLYHKHQFSVIAYNNKPLSELLHKAVNQLRLRVRIYRICIPVFAVVLFTWFSLRFSGYSIMHLFWIIPVCAGTTELLLKLLYGRTINELRSMIQQLQGE